MIGKGLKRWANIEARFAVNSGIGLRDIVWAGEKKDRDLFTRKAGDIDRAVNAIARLIPINLSGCDWHMHLCPVIAELNQRTFAFQDNRNTMKRICVPLWPRRARV